jgi:hypothetical protein
MVSIMGGAMSGAGKSLDLYVSYILRIAIAITIV